MVQSVRNENFTRAIFLPHQVGFPCSIAKFPLILKIFSLLVCVGNCAKSRCGTAVSFSSPTDKKITQIYPVLN
jgi:hypothetical protein